MWNRVNAVYNLAHFLVALFTKDAFFLDYTRTDHCNLKSILYSYETLAEFKLLYILSQTIQKFEDVVSSFTPF